MSLVNVDSTALEEWLPNLKVYQDHLEGLLVTDCWAPSLEFPIGSIVQKQGLTICILTHGPENLLTSHFPSGTDAAGLGTKL